MFPSSFASHRTPGSLFSGYSVDGAERISCTFIDAHIAAKNDKNILATFEGCCGTIEKFDPHRGGNEEGGRGRYKVRLELSRAKKPVGRLAPGGMFSTGEVRYSGGKVVWLHPRHVLVGPMTAVTVIPPAAEGGLRDGATASSGRVVGYTRCTAPDGPATITSCGCTESVQSLVRQSRTIQADPTMAMSMPSMLEYGSRKFALKHVYQMSLYELTDIFSRVRYYSGGGRSDKATIQEPWLAGHYAELRVVVKLDDDGGPFGQVPSSAVGKAQMHLEQGLFCVAPRHVVLPCCWWENKSWTPSVVDAAQAQAARTFEPWRWADAFEKLVDQVGGVYASLPSCLFWIA